MSAYATDFHYTVLNVLVFGKMVGFFFSVFRTHLQQVRVPDSQRQEVIFHVCYELPRVKI